MEHEYQPDRTLGHVCLLQVIQYREVTGSLMRWLSPKSIPILGRNELVIIKWKILDRETLSE